MLAEPGHYDYAPYTGRPKIVWPNGARIAVWVAPNIEHYELELAEQSAQGALASAGARHPQLLPPRLRQPHRLLAHGRRHGQARRCAAAFR